MGSEWFDYTEPYLTASSQEEQGAIGCNGVHCHDPIAS